MNDVEDSWLLGQASFKFDEVVYGGAKPIPEGVVGLAGFPANGSVVVNYDHLRHGFTLPAGDVVTVEPKCERHQVTVTVALFQPRDASRDVRFAENAPRTELLDSGLVDQKKFLWVLEPVGLLSSAEKFDGSDGFDAHGSTVYIGLDLNG